MKMGVSSQEPDGDDPYTRRVFSLEKLGTLAHLRSDLGLEALRTDVRKWFQQKNGQKYAPAWIVKNRFIVKKNEHGRGAVCILDPERLPANPFPPVVNRPKKSNSG
jgi:hypothetical protein